MPHEIAAMDVLEVIFALRCKSEWAKIQKRVDAEAAAIAEME